MTVSVSYRSPDTFNVDRMKDLIYEAVDSQPDGLVVSIPDPSIAPAIRRAERAGIPVVSINSGANLWRDLGVLAHVGQRETPAGYQVGKRMAAAGVKRALCVKQELRNNALDQRCAGFARGMREGGGEREQLRPRRHRPRHRRAQAAGRAGGAEGRRRPDPLERRGQDVARGQEGGRPRDQGEARHLRPLARDPRGGQGRADAVRGRPAGLPAGLHADRDADPADPLRPLPVKGQTVSTGPNFVTKENAELALQTSARGIRYSGGAPRAAAPGSASRRRPG